MSLIGRMWDEASIIGAADAFEKNFSRTAAKI
jgi:Asp-tRNA(Asn)/Glu-tRNA(Gln) amidotransferase A subunit family amidase